MSKRRRKSRGSGKAPPFWFGAIFILAGCLIAGVGSGWIPVDPDSVHAPGWVIVLVGWMFALGGVMCYTSRLGETFNHGLALLMMTAFALVFTWVALGPGEREFSGGVSLGPVTSSDRANEGIGRAMFGLGALLGWAIVAAIGARWLKGLRGEEP